MAKRAQSRGFIVNDGIEPKTTRRMARTLAEAEALTSTMVRIQDLPLRDGTVAYATAYEALCGDEVGRARVETFRQALGYCIVPLDRVKYRKTVIVYFAEEAESSATTGGDRVHGKKYKPGWYCGRPLPHRARGMVQECVFGARDEYNVSEIILDPSRYAREDQAHAREGVPTGTWFYVGSKNVAREFTS